MSSARGRAAASGSSPPSRLPRDAALVPPRARPRRHHRRRRRHRDRRRPPRRRRRAAAEPRSRRTSSNARGGGDRRDGRGEHDARNLNLRWNGIQAAGANALGDAVEATRGCGCSTSRSTLPPQHRRAERGERPGEGAAHAARRVARTEEEEEDPAGRDPPLQLRASALSRVSLLLFGACQRYKYCLISRPAHVSSGWPPRPWPSCTAARRRRRAGRATPSAGTRW